MNNTIHPFRPFQSSATVGRRLALVSVLTTAALTACTAESDLDFATEEDSEGESEGDFDPRLYYVTDKIWDDTDISVCWSAAGFATEKQWVEEALRGQRSWAAGANINLLGWGTCLGGNPGGIELIPGDSMVTWGLSDPSADMVIELDFTASPQTSYTRCILNGLDREECIKTVALHEFGHALAFAHEHNRGDTPGSCTAAPQGTNGDATYGAWDEESIMNYCDAPPQLSAFDRLGAARLYGAGSHDAPQAGDYNGDGRDDLLCHDAVDGDKWIDYASASGQFSGTNWTLSTNWCSHSSARLFKGDFNGNGHTDLLCHDLETGYKWVDFANGSGQFFGTNWSRNANWCAGSAEELFIDDFDGDGRDDMLCHNTEFGTKWVDYANASGHFMGTDWWLATNWCSHDAARLYTGDFNGDGHTDLLCHDLDTGHKWVDYANANGQFYGTNWSRNVTWCAGDAHELLIGDFDGDGHDDMLCHNADTGYKWIDFANANGQFYGTNWSNYGNWCSHPTARISVGDYNGDGRDDLLCHDVVSGQKWVDYADAWGYFTGTNATSSNWCAEASMELH